MVDGSLLPPFKQKKSTQTIAALAARFARATLECVLSIPNWIGAQLHISSAWASRGGFIILSGLAMTFIQLDEYALAMIMWIASAIVLLAKSIHWKGPANRPALTLVLRCSFILLSLAVVPLLWKWTKDKRGDKAWTVFQGKQSAMSHLSGCETGNLPSENIAASPKPSDAPDTLLLSESLLIEYGINQLQLIEINATRKSMQHKETVRIPSQANCFLLQDWQLHLAIPAVRVRDEILKRLPIEDRISSQTERIRLAYQSPTDVHDSLTIVSGDLDHLRRALEKSKQIKEAELPKKRWMVSLDYGRRIPPDRSPTARRN